jgi:SAM-dependent methyltransferase
MGRGTVFLVPRRPDGGVRDRLWNRCRSHWQESCPGIPIVEGTSPEGPFNRAAAINRAADGPWDVAIILDADVVVPAAQIHEAVEVARSTERLTLAFTDYVGLNAQTTEKVLRGAEPRVDRGVWVRKRNHESSAVVVPRPLWDEAGGFDERFVGWGQEDVAFAQACRVLGGELQRVSGAVIHLWHPKTPEKDRRLDGWKANQALGRRYRETKEPEAMRDLLAERFTSIWKRNAWNGTETKAGPGSTRGATQRLVEALPKLLEEMGISSVLDAGCADSWWMPELPGYIGVDIVPQAIERARELHPDREFLVADICADELPKCEAVLIRDALQHLSLKDGLTALQNFRRMGAKWLLASSHEGEENSDVPSGGYYPCNLEAAPFWLGHPRWKIPDGVWDSGMRYPNKVFGLWEL